MDSKHAKRKREEKKNQQEKMSRLELTVGINHETMKYSFIYHPN